MRRYFNELGKAVCEQLKVGRIILYKAAPSDMKTDTDLLLLGISEKIVKSIDNHNLMVYEQQKLILDYAE